MALQPLLNSAGKQLYVLRRISDKFVINPRAISNTTSTPNPGPDQEYLPIKKEEVVPDYDPRFTVLSTNEAPNAGETEVHITYTVTDRPEAEVHAAIDNAERLQVQEHFNRNDCERDVRLLLAAIFRQAKNLELTPEEEALVEANVGIASKLTQNKAIAAELKAQVTAGNKPDIDAAWVAKE